MTDSSPDIIRHPHKPQVCLRAISPDDLTLFFEQQLDPSANHMAAFTAKNPTDRHAFDAHWAKILGDDAITLRTILYLQQVAGYVVCHTWFGEPEVGYWLGVDYWGKGIATQALELFLEVETRRPLFARVAKDNIASIHVLENNGFTRSGEDKGYANARGEVVEEYIYKFDRSL